jgi:hypothetical protein
MTDPALIARANKIIDRLFALDEEIANGRAFRALLEDLHARDLSVVKEPHIAAITVVRAAILRAVISSVVACLDRGDRRRNRASIGQASCSKMQKWALSSTPEQQHFSERMMNMWTWSKANSLSVEEILGTKRSPTC